MESIRRLKAIIYKVQSVSTRATKTELENVLAEILRIARGLA